MTIDKKLPQGVSRRDFVQGAAAGSAAAAIATWPAGAAAASAAGTPSLVAHPAEPGGYYPPLRQGMRGSHPGSFEVAHALRDGKAVGQALAGPAHETYDLVVVGGGISGLSAALFYRDKNPGARVLILENHDDFGGHAKRNEFRLRDGRIALENGGTYAIESPRPYNALCDGLLKRLGIDTAALIKETEGKRGETFDAAGLTPALFFDKENFGRDQLVRYTKDTPLAQALAGAPLPPEAIAQIATLEAGKADAMAGLDALAKKDALSRISYRDYLMKHGGLGEDAIKLYQNRPLGWWTVGADGIAAIDAWGMDFPGFKALDLPPGSIPRMGYTPAGYADTGGSYDFHFPDGNATIARRLVANLIPGFTPAKDGVEGVLAPVDYSVLDREGQPVRLRLSSTVVHAVNRAGAGADVVYSHAGQVHKVAARHVVMACWNMIIPYIIPSLPAKQKEALHELVKEPLVYVNVALDNWRAFQAAGVNGIQFPTAYYQTAQLDRATEIGGYKGPSHPDEPITMQLIKIPNTPGLPEHDQSRAGRAILLGTDFATFESNLVDLMERALGPHGFVASRDITGITVNRWPHGYAPEYNPLWDSVMDGPDAPNVIGRQKFGAITIANSDSGRAAYTDSAINQAWRAVNELFA